MVARLGVRLELFFSPGRLKEGIEAHLVSGLEMLYVEVTKLRRWERKFSHLILVTQIEVLLEMKI